MSLKNTSSINWRSAGYWTATTVIALAFLSGGAAYLARAETPMRGMAELGYPAYFVVMLGAWKVLGAFAILMPRLPLLKEWAYAGIAFDLIGATFSHAGVGHPPMKTVVPLILLAIMAASWSLRPQDRRLVGGSEQERWSPRKFPLVAPPKRARASSV